MSVPKSGSLSKNNSTPNALSWSSLIDDIFNRDLPSVFSSNFNTGISLPKVNIKESADEFIVEMAVPGLKKSDFKIDLDNNMLSISTETEIENEKNEENYTRREFGYSSFKRAFTLPDSVNEDEIDASYNDGILKITLPKKEEAKQKPARTISIS